MNDLVTSMPASVESDPAVRQRLVALLKALAPGEGYTPTALPGVRILRSDRALARTPVLYDPGIVIVCQGRKRGYFGDQLYVYDAQHYLAVSVPVPFSMETDASPSHPLLALYLHLDFTMAAELAAQIDGEHAGPRSGPDLQDSAVGPSHAGSMSRARPADRAVGDAPVRTPRSMMSTPMDAAMQVSVMRLLEALQQPLEAEVLGPGLLRELYFRVLTGEQGAGLRAALAMRGQFGRIGLALRQIHAEYAQALDVAALARVAGMSTPSFHSHFKAITHVSPMQYVKSVRLHQARLLMVRQSMTAEAASHAVGYASASQFSREFKRLFGLTPAAEIRRMCEHFAVPEAFADAVYVSSH